VGQAVAAIGARGLVGAFQRRFFAAQANDGIGSTARNVSPSANASDSAAKQKPT